MTEGNTTENDEGRAESDDQQRDSAADDADTDTFAFRSTLDDSADTEIDASVPDRPTDESAETRVLPADSEPAARRSPVEDGGTEPSANADERGSNEIESAALDSESTDNSRADDTARVDLSEPSYYLNRELSELAFQRRVLYTRETRASTPTHRGRG